MNERDEALQATASDLIADATALSAIEEQKASLEADDPRQDRLAADAEALVREMVPKAAAQREIVAEVDGTADPGSEEAVEPA